MARKEPTNSSIYDTLQLGVRSLLISIGIFGVITILSEQQRGWCWVGSTDIGFPFAFYSRDMFSGDGSFLWGGILKDTGCIFLGTLLIWIGINRFVRTKRGD
jgi:hypothetical protein